MAHTTFGVEVEHDIQAAIVEWAELMGRTKYPSLALLYAVPNGGHRHKKTARTLKEEGVKAGVPDLVLPVTNYIWPGFYLEIKTSKGRVRGEQKWWHNELRSQGYCVEVARSVDEGVGYLESYVQIPSVSQVKDTKPQEDTTPTNR